MSDYGSWAFPSTIHKDSASSSSWARGVVGYHARLASLDYSRVCERGPVRSRTCPFCSVAHHWLFAALCFGRTALDALTCDIITGTLSILSPAPRPVPLDSLPRTDSRCIHRDSHGFGTSPSPMEPVAGSSGDAVGDPAERPISAFFSLPDHTA